MLIKVGNEPFFFLLSSGYLQGIFGINGGGRKSAEDKQYKLTFLLKRQHRQHCAAINFLPRFMRY